MIMFYEHVIRYIENICFFEVNTKYISSSELKTSEFSRVFSTHEMKYIWYSPKTSKFLFILYNTGDFPIHKAGGENEKKNKNTNNFGTTLFLTS